MVSVYLVYHRDVQWNMGFLLYFKSRSSIVGIGAWAPLYSEGINSSSVQSAYSSSMDGLHGKWLEYSHRQEKFISKVKEKPSTVH